MKYLMLLLLFPTIVSAQREAGFIGDFRIFKKALTENHPALYRFNPKEAFQQAFDSIEQEIQKGTDEIEFFSMLSQVTTLIGEGHSHVSPSEDLMQAVYASKLFPFEVFVKEDRLLITQSLSKEYGYLVGKEIHQINGVSVSSILKKIQRSAGLKYGFNNSAIKHVLSYSNNFAVAYFLFVGNPEVFHLESMDSNPISVYEISASGVVHLQAENTVFPKFPPEPIPPFTFEIL
ncbi:MAG: hypothetical protein AAGC88_01300, partial [Bacteroidota bacterium]